MHRTYNRYLVADKLQLHMREQGMKFKASLPAYRWGSSHTCERRGWRGRRRGRHFLARDGPPAAGAGAPGRSCGGGSGGTGGGGSGPSDGGGDQRDERRRRPTGRERGRGPLDASPAAESARERGSGRAEVAAAADPDGPRPTEGARTSGRDGGGARASRGPAGGGEQAQATELGSGGSGGGGKGARESCSVCGRWMGTGGGVGGRRWNTASP
uniref:Uncharacterized protein n=1 Tax=Setaria viridis TaxID=4556 RepID=A0A4U6VUR9_SETVI|nr:hypothetical protein SEVIR_2G256100v2 [Setaria viridis]